VVSLVFLIHQWLLETGSAVERWTVWYSAFARITTFIS